jgi:hypothetical protein
MREGSKSFYMASWLLPAWMREPALALYSFCRKADDDIDEARVQLYIHVHVCMCACTYAYACTQYIYLFKLIMSIHMCTYVSGIRERCVL